MSDKSCDAWPEAIADDVASLLWFCEKQFSTKETQEAPLPKKHRKLQENHNVFNEYSRQNASALDQFRRRTNHLLRAAQIVQSNKTAGVVSTTEIYYDDRLGGIERSALPQ
jgi:hypothetical protein